MIREFPGCGMYCTAFDILSRDGLFPAPTLRTRGVVENFFRDSAHRYIAIPSAVCIPKAVFGAVGGFPEGMKIAEDLHMWIRIASRYPVCFSPERLACYSKVASNRSAAGYTPERTRHSFEELYDPSAPAEKREFIARAALGKALILSAKGDTEAAARRTRVLLHENLPPHAAQSAGAERPARRMAEPPLLGLYDALAWRLARRGSLSGPGTPPRGCVPPPGGQDYSNAV